MTTSGRLLRALASSIGLLWVCGIAVGGEPESKFLRGLLEEMHYVDGQTWKPAILAISLPPDWTPVWDSTGLPIPVRRTVFIDRGEPSVETARKVVDTGDSAGADARSTFKIARPAMRAHVELIERLVSRLRGASFALVMGIQPTAESDVFVVPVSEHDRGITALILSVAPEDIASVVDDAKTYLELTSSDTLDPTLWSRVRSITSDAIRFAAIRDVLHSSYGRGLQQAPVDVRRALLSQLIDAASPDRTQAPTDRLRAVVFAQDVERSTELLGFAVGADRAWWVNVVAKGSPEARSAAIMAAASIRLAEYSKPLAVDIAVAYLSRGDGLASGELTQLRKLVQEAPPVVTQNDERGSTLLVGLTASLKSPNSHGADPNEVVGLLVDVANRDSNIRLRLAARSSAEDSNRTELESWLRKVRPRHEEDRRVIEAFSAQFGVPH